ncbi:hypothetical protein K7X08_003019 [Anisodus acutangulus]|uniref:UMP kinase n=1 Tax=Anisodus acutangulus TaxID=402998 RepID=A0A9Q1MGN3_9SOLA|nr:hypothetical protein K7X08_003019 [Anisodus acutangulus]
MVLKEAKVDGVFDDDPRLNPDARLQETLTYHDVTFKELFVMVMTTITLCQENNIPVVVFNLNKPGNITKAIKGEGVSALIEADGDGEINGAENNVDGLGLNININGSNENGEKSPCCDTGGKVAGEDRAAEAARGAVVAGLLAFSIEANFAAGDKQELEPEQEVDVSGTADPFVDFVAELWRRAAELRRRATEEQLEVFLSCRNLC